MKCKNMLYLIPIASIFSMPAMALLTGNSANCDDTALAGATDGDVNLTASYTANTISVSWYNDDSQISGPTQCTYDGTLSLPSRPADKTGYTFGGWRVRSNAPTQITLASLIGDAISVPTNFNGYASISGTTIANNINGSSNFYPFIGNGEWGVSIDGTRKIMGKALCSAQGGTPGSTSMISQYYENDNTSTNCWCKITRYMPNTTDTQYFYSDSWVFRNNIGSSCTSNCATMCASGFSSMSSIQFNLLNSAVRANTINLINTPITQASGLSAVISLTGNINQNANAFGLSAYGDFGVTVNTSMGDGKLTGTSMCNNINGSVGEKRLELPKTNSGGINCWCHATGFMPTSGSESWLAAQSRWALGYVFSDSGTCQNSCAQQCMQYARTNSW